MDEWANLRIYEGTNEKGSFALNRGRPLTEIIGWYKKCVKTHSKRLILTEFNPFLTGLL